MNTIVSMAEMREYTALSLVDRKIGFYDEWMASGHRPPLIPVGVPIDRPEAPVLEAPKRKRGARASGVTRR